MTRQIRYLASMALVFAFSLATSTTAFSQNDDDVASAEYYAKKLKDDDVLATTSYRFFTFDKGKNDLDEKVVTIQEEGTYEFLSLKKFSALTFLEFYNKFIELKTFRREIKFGNKYVQVQKAGVDRSVTDEGIFFDDSRMQFYPIRMTQKGMMNKITVKKHYSDGRFLTRLFFHASYPSKETVIEFKVPDWVTVEFKRMNFEGYNIQVQENKKGGYTSYVFNMKDVPAYKSEYRRIGRAFTDPHIIIQIRSFKSKNEEFRGFDKVDDVYAWNSRMYKMSDNKTGEIQQQLAKITQGKGTDEEKIKAIYYWVQDNIRYIAYEDGYSGYVPATVQEVMSKKYGDCKGMANLLTEMLKMAGYDARFSWIGTRQIPYSQSLPALCVNNHAISTLYFKGKTYFLDGTESYAPFGEDAVRIQGKEVMVSNGDKFEIVKVPETSADESKIITKADFSIEGADLKGKVKVTLTGNQRKDFHQTYQTLPKSSQKEHLEEFISFGNDNVEPGKITTSDLNNRELPVTIEGQVNFINSVNSINGDQYAGIDFFPKSLERFIPDDKRVQGYDLGEVISFEDELTLSIPANRTFVDRPDNLELNYPGYSFKGEYIQQEGKMTLKKKLVIKNSIIPKKDFDNWKKFIESIREFNRYLLTVTNK